jgi:hypothetical protein
MFDAPFDALGPFRAVLDLVMARAQMSHLNPASRDFVWFFSTDGAGLGTSTGSSVTWQVPTTSCSAITPVRGRTWGWIKSLYRSDGATRLAAARPRVGCHVKTSTRRQCGYGTLPA